VWSVFLFIPIIAALRGWPWRRQPGGQTSGEVIKFVALVIIAVTIVGLIPITYWTGKGGLEWLAEKGLIRI
jgi:hypothetical protein